MLNNRKKKVTIISAIILVFFVALSYNYCIQRKFNETDRQLNRLSDWIDSKNVLYTSTLDDNKNIFTFDHIGFGKEGDVGWTRIMKNNEIKDSLGFYTRHIDPILTSLTENTLIGSAWQ